MLIVNKKMRLQMNITNIEEDSKIKISLIN